MSEQDDAHSSIKQRRSRRTTPAANQQNDKQALAPQCPASDDKEAWKAYWITQGQHWRTEPEIDVERQQYLTERRNIHSNIEQGIYPFKDIKLTRADVEWLIVKHSEERSFIDRQKPEVPVPNLIIRTGLDLRGADLRGVDLHRLPLAGLRGSIGWEDWQAASELQREAAAIHLEGANLSLTDLTRSALRSAHLEGADLYYVHLEGANLRGAHFGGYKGHKTGNEDHVTKLETTNLNAAFFSSASNLDDIDLGNTQNGYADLIDIRWGGVNLTKINWKKVKMLGHEQKVRRKKRGNGNLENGTLRLKDYEEAIRANRQLSITLQAQGLNEDAAHFAYHAQIMQRKSLWYQRKFGQHLFSLLLDLLAGYGFRPGRSVIWYLVMIFGFALAYFTFGHLPFFPDAFVFSLTSFHGRGFFPGLGSENSLHNPLVVIAAFEAVIGLLIEISFIATFTQRFFGR